MHDSYNRQAFQVYRTQDNSDSEEDIITRTEPTFDTMEQASRQATRIPTIEEQILTLMAGMQELLRNNQERSSLVHPRLPEPDTFHGDRSPGAVESWVRVVERYLELSSWQEHQWVPYAVLRLRGEAETWWVQQTLYGNEVSEWAAFRSMIIKEYRPINATQAARDQIADLKQTGTVSEYVDKFRSARILVPSMTDEEALDRFRRGLQPDVQAHVATHYPTTSEEAEKRALGYESAMKIVQSITNNVAQEAQPSQSRTPEYLRSNGVAPMDLDAVYAMQQSWRNNGPPRFRGSRFGGNNHHDKQCYRCGGMGHIARICPSQSGSSSSSSPSRSFGPRRNQDLKGKARQA